MKAKQSLRFTIIIFSALISISSVVALLSLLAIPVSAVEGVNEAGLAITKTVSDEPLIGGDIGYTIQVENTANTGDTLEDDKAYNITITDTLPAGLTYQSASLAPTQIINNPDGTTSLIWNDIVDLEQRETTSISILATIDSSVLVGGQITNTTSVEANTLPDNSGTWLRDETYVVATVQAIDIEKELVQSTGVNQTTGASGWESTAPGTGAGAEWAYQYRLTIRNNNVDDTSNVIVTDTLPSGVAYLGPVTINPNPNGVPVAPVMTVLPSTGELQLVWNLGTLTTNEYNNPVVITFGVGVPYRERVDLAGGASCINGNVRIPNSTTPSDPGCFDGAIVADHSTWDNGYEATGVYSATATADGSVSTPSDDPEIPVTAVYQTVEKSVTPETVEYSDILTYTIDFYVSEYYTLTNDVITDVLPDGLTYVAGSATIAPAAVFTDTPNTGETTIVWNLADTLTTPGSQGQIIFRASVDTDYEQLVGEPPIVALDSLINLVTMSGDWTDDVDPANTGSTVENASAIVSTLGPHIEKTVRDPSGAFVKGPVTATIGDELVFRVHYHAPSGMSADNNYLADFLPRGMELVSQLTCVATGIISNTYTDATSGDTDNDPCTYYTYTVGGLEVVRWNYGYVYQNFAMTSTIQAKVIDVPEVADGVLVENFLKASGTNTSGDTYSLRDTADIQYVEPDVVLIKNVVPETGLQVGDTVTYTIDIQPTGVITAYNLIVTDTIPVGVMVNLASCVPPACSVLSGSPEIGAGGVISWTMVPALGPGETLTLRYNAEITTSVTVGLPVVNIATVSYNTQADGSGRQTPGTSDTNDPNTDDAAINVGPIALIKSIAATSEDHTTINPTDTVFEQPEGRPQVAIGEIIRYRVVTLLPEGTAPDFMLQDYIPGGLQFLDDNTATVAFISNDGGITTTSGIPSGCEATLNVTGNSYDGVTPQCVIPDNGATSNPTNNDDNYGSGSDVFFKFFETGADLVNLDTDADSEYIVIEFNALVLNNAETYADRTRLNVVVPVVDNVWLYDLGAPIDVRIVEPQLEIEKIATPKEVEVGDIVTFTLLINNNEIGVDLSGRDTTDAFDLRITDTLPSELSLQNVTFSTPVSGTVTDNTSAPMVDLLVSRLNRGETMVVTVTAQVNLVLTEIITNVSHVTWTSLPGTGTTSNPTGSTIPGSSGAGNGERNGTTNPTNINDYAANSSDTIVSILTGAIGDYVWVDENGDGFQDAGESGIPNVIMELYTITGTLVTTTTTDADGGYLFANIPAGIVYRVTVRTSSLPDGLAANPTYDEDGTGTPNTTSGISLTAGEEHLTADFGYNWVPSSDSTNPGAGATGAIGDRVWNDADGDGVQDPGEAGIFGVTVTIYYDPDGDGVYDTPYPNALDGDGNSLGASGQTTTDAAGNYIFDDLPTGAYVVRVTAPGGYSQTGDPDESSTCTTCDNQTTTPIILAPGDVYLNADFGYQPTGTTNTIGDQIFVDLNGDGNLDGGEPGIPGVTVALLDENGNVIATTLTDSNGQYSFTGLPDGTYTVWVNDTNNLLGELTQNSTPDNANDGGQPCGTCNGQNTVTVSGGTGNLFQDFGYTPINHDAGDGLIGDTIFLDLDGGGDYDPGEGLEGVVIELYDSSGTILLAVTTTDENGHYYFGDLPAGDYVVRVDTDTLPTGVTNTIDPDGGTANESNVSLSAGEIDLTQDFGYTAGSPHTISGTIWKDTDADGILDGGACEGGCFQGITLVLYDSDGNVVATTTTDSSGNYSFPGLPDGTYRVDVTDEGNVLNGYWHSQGDQSQSSDGTSKADPYTVVLSGSDVNTVDFGYYVDPAVVGNFVWLDLNDDGVQDTNEPGIEGITVTLTITYPNGDTATLVTATDKNGLYSFGNLLLDESFNSGDAGVGTPTYTISVGTPPSMTSSPENATAPGNDDQIDFDSDGASEIATVNQGETDPSYDFGFFGRVDLGDLPDNVSGSPDYPTYFQPGPSHIVFTTTNDIPATTNGIPAVWLGSIVDTETNGQPNMPATGDDDNGDDEDGLTFAQNGYLPGATKPVTITINASESEVTVYYGLWIDWDQDAVFDDFFSGSMSSGSPVDVAVNITVPAGYVARSPVYFRVRALDTPLSANDYEGTFVNGEVEDYGRAFDAAPTAIRLRKFSAQNADSIPVLWLVSMSALMIVPAVIVWGRRKHGSSR